ncbi:cytospin-A isoform X2 [Synchiropus splendidus]|uniref:cytospin-A isoform X2 n=1 Tax=Synchiropus splendidus TaxID=270530 RepID=UPI00237D54A7|nr:cytospin-A isoform X2 [Synchiropus splendidus]
MGNHNGKDGHLPTGSSLDFFQTPPTTPSEGKLAALAVSTAISSSRVQAASLPSPITDWAQKLPAPAEWAVISCDVTSEGGGGPARGRKGRGCLASLPSSRGSPSEQSWQERDSGLGAAVADASGDEMSLVFLSLMEHYRSSLGPDANTDAAAGAVELLRRLISERDELSEEVLALRDTLKSERSEWQQFQCDLQTAVSVANRLRVESEQSRRGAEEQLARTQRELEALRAEHSDTCRRLIQLQQQTEEAEEQQQQQQQQQQEEEAVGKDGGVETDGAESLQLTGKGVAEGYIRSLAAHEKKREQREPRRTVLPERSWSLSRIPTDAFSQRHHSLSTSTTLPLCKKEEPKRSRRSDQGLLRQDSWSSFSAGKPEQEQNPDPGRPQDGFSALLRRHGGSRRNSLLRWSQTRTDGYQNIEVTNFSSSWEDGLAFCALYHSYLPERVPYLSLDPACKRENLDLAFTTGQSVGIPATLTAEEMLKPGGPDWQKVLDYVESIFRHFEV